MKLGLLVLLAVAVLGPSVSGNRIVSICELKEKLDAALVLPKAYDAWKNKYLARAICELTRRSGLNTDLIRVFGHRIPTTTAAPTTVPVSTAGTDMPISLAGSLAPFTTTTTTTTIPAPTTATATTTTSTTTSTAAPSTTEPTTVEPLTANFTETNSTSGGSRRKRSVTGIDEDMEAMLYDQQNVFDEQEMEEDYNHVQDEDDEEEEVEEEFEEQESPEEAFRVKRGARRSSDENSSEDRKPRRKKVKKQKLPWSIGYYGLFQLSDGHFCNSGYRWSRNVCNTTCTAFADDNITDDIECFVSSGYWWYILRKVSRRCYRATNFLDGC
ncbi:uncharacterized protein LOC124999739 isoform X2 [Mugil cephalus]|uniref:uncharacterized protein LOC124999739 isoform X2 n=1 Tax=Mugil cephalus TaxID=48193 RepID=UPI001FB5E5AF|nr:uncharacterized protein LOC124999739 isoform X2 [Mugil cephalus]